MLVNLERVEEQGGEEQLGLLQTLVFNTLEGIGTNALHVHECGIVTVEGTNVKYAFNNQRNNLSY